MIGRSGDRKNGRTADRQIGKASDRENAVSCPSNLRINRSPDWRALVRPISGSPDHLVGRLSFTRSPDHPIDGLLFTQSPDQPISRSPDHPVTRLARSPQCVSCFIVLFLLLGCTELVNPALCSFRPSPPWGRGWTAAGVFSSPSADGAGEGVAGLRASVCGSRAGSAFGNGSTDSLDEYVRRFDSSYHAVQTIRANFTQTYASEGRTRIESGMVYFARGGLMRWDYQRPQPKLFLS